MFATESTRAAHLDVRAARVLNMLDSWSDRLQGHQTQKREHPRRRFRSRVTVYLADAERGVGESVQSRNFDVWGRNISQGGLAFISEEQISAEKVVVCLDPQTDGRLWFEADVVRSRQVHDGFWEFGVCFTGTAEI